MHNYFILYYLHFQYCNWIVIVNWSLSWYKGIFVILHFIMISVLQNLNLFILHFLRFPLGSGVPSQKLIVGFGNPPWERRCSVSQCINRPARAWLLLHRVHGILDVDQLNFSPCVTRCSFTRCLFVKTCHSLQKGNPYLEWTGRLCGALHWRYC